MENNKLGVEWTPEGTTPTTDWGRLVARFQQLAKTTGTDKASSYGVEINFDFYGGIYLSLGTYDIGDWPRHTEIGPFNDEPTALKALEDLVIKAEKAVSEMCKIPKKE